VTLLNLVVRIPFQSLRIFLALLRSLCCFSTSVNNYLAVYFDLKTITSIPKLTEDNLKIVHIAIHFHLCHRLSFSFPNGFLVFLEHRSTRLTRYRWDLDDLVCFDAFRRHDKDLEQVNSLGLTLVAALSSSNSCSAFRLACSLATRSSITTFS